MDSVQQQCIQAVEKGQNIFITGSAGTGKSFTIQKIVHLLSDDQKRISICALTGCAAVLLDSGAYTLHSWAGVGTGSDAVMDLYLRVSKNRKALERWKKTDLLIIDEVSMLGPSFFEKLDDLGRLIRKKHKDKPFGGIQLVLVGDFFQLPPVEEEEFLFQSERFQNAIDKTFVLQTIYRQSTDHRWYNLLQNIRVGKISEDDIRTLNKRKKAFEDGSKNHTVLFPLNRDVDRMNSTQLEGLSSKVVKKSVRIKKDPQVHDFAIQNLMKLFSIPPHLFLAQGALVILTWNLDIQAGLVNGSRGVIVGFDANLDPVVEFEMSGQRVSIPPKEYLNTDSNGSNGSSDPKISIFQYPLRLAWALSIHKVQGHNLDSATMNLGGQIFEYGQVYVALSRIKTLEGVFLSDFDPSRIRAHPVVMEYYEKLLA